MAPSATVAAAERKAMEGKNESQDTQELVDRYRTQLGVGILGSSPPPAIPTSCSNPTANPQSARAQRPKELRLQVTQTYVMGPKMARRRKMYGQMPPPSTKTRQNATLITTSHGPDTTPTPLCVDDAARPSLQPNQAGHPDSHVPPLEKTKGEPNVSPTGRPGDAVDGSRTAANLDVSLSTLPDRAPPDELHVPPPLDGGTVPGSKMSFTQSTTQSNEERTGSYDRYFPHDSLGDDDGLQDTAPLVDHAQAASHDRTSLLSDDDHGAVRLQFSDKGDDETESVAGRETGDPDLSLRPSTRADSQVASASLMPPPETPANPFAGRNMGVMAPMSDLFKQTQFSSAVQPAAMSPTSSRPSPDMFLNNSISPNQPAPTSPLRRRDPALNTSPSVFPSSPQFPPPTSPRLDDEAVTQLVNGSSVPEPEDPEIPESPRPKALSQKALLEPVDCYEPTKLSQKRRGLSEPKASQAGGSNSSDEEGLAPRKRARSKRNAAPKTLKSLAIPRKGSGAPDEEDEVEVPSTNKKATRSRSPAAVQRRPRARGRRKDPYEFGSNSSTRSQSSIADSQEKARPDAAASSREAIPETSPPPDARSKRAASRTATRSSNPAIPSLSIPEIPSDLADTQSPRLPPMKNKVSQVLATKTSQFSPSASEIQAANDASVVLGQKQADTPLAPKSSAHSLAPPTSALTSLTGTPNISSSTTPATETSRRSILSSPAGAKARRRGSTQPLPVLANESVRSGRVTRRSVQRSPPSTDELARGETPAPEHNLRTLRLGRLSTLSAHDLPVTEGSVRGPKIFDGMVFAISFQSTGKSSRVAYNGRTESVATVTKKIRQSGGRVLEIGFDELFEVQHVKSAATSPTEAPNPDPDIKLTAAAARVVGFAALIADGHSRKTKYMQALALGLPCLSARWITACVDSNEIVDWSPYLLCAGQSSFLGDAMRSRNLPPYDAKTALLQEVINRRPRLLSGSNILLVMKRADTAKTTPYIFLAQALGASLTRAFTVEEARVRLKEMEDIGQPYDWVYIDEKTDKGVLFDEAPAAISVSKAADAPPGSLGSKSKKRKRGSAANSAATSMVAYSGPPPKRIRTLSNELVIQSLILGRLIEADEMKE
ncbi:hypothetical protein GGTG_06972 [Gaeumannomyces tritici R3-111a-1]|uniref:BRCT domain-containing protein n=1 Tax=Gaeumannomyces tritici (strain R3-111a-1) TaxID=644352 RepID=J3P0C5_GAET3|nr:hypothetical protein GGTG_06972 [Gaeumannomyces tritici R3-111a-1]EJT77058.1 hypothetical protein GGTG_06972 [Gaeumannomyces tritici R3-111a-1]